MAFELENYYIKKADAVESKDYYNETYGGTGSSMFYHEDPERRKRVRKTLSEKNKGTNVGANSGKAKKVICINNKKIFDTEKQACESIGRKSGYISKKSTAYYNKLKRGLVLDRCSAGIDDEEAIIYTLTYKNTSDKDIVFELSLGIYSDLEGGFTEPHDDYLDGIDDFLKNKGITIEEFRNSKNSDVYQNEFHEQNVIILKPYQENTYSFTIKKSDILGYMDDKSNSKDTSIQDFLSKADTALVYCYGYKLDDNNFVSIEYNKYPNKDVIRRGYIDNHNNL